MTRKDYIAIADMLGKIRYRLNLEVSEQLKETEYQAGQFDMLNKVTDELCDALKRDNGRFDRDHFLAVVRGEKALTSRP